MIQIIIITNGELGGELVRTAEGIVGRQEGITVVTLKPEDSLATMCERTESIIRSIPPEDGALIMTDMLGGTPCNACLPFSQHGGVEIVSGVNLSMLLSAFINRRVLNLDQLVKKVMHDGVRSIANAKEMFMKKLG
jgi:PTS system mannose-specific IIA component